MITVPADRFEVRPSAGWAAAIIAALHRREDERETGSWSCTCRCCLWAIAELGPK